MYTFRKLLFGVFPVAGASHLDRAQPAAVPASLMRQTGQLTMDLDLTSQFQPTFGALGQRQNSAATTSASTSTSTAGAVCGYLQGSSAVSLTCQVPRACAVATLQRVWGCCQTPLTDCKIITSCVPASSLASCQSDPSCVQNIFVTQCAVAIPFCNEYVLQGAGNVPVTGWGCNSTPQTYTLLATATDGNQSSASYAYVSITPQTFAPSTTSRGSTTTPILTPASTSTSASSTLVPVPGSKPTPIGALVGGVIGGVAVILALGAGLYFLLRRKRDSAATAPQHTYQTPPSPLRPTPVRPEISTPYFTPHVQKPIYQPTTAPHSLGSFPNQQQGSPPPPLRTPEIYSPPQTPSPQYATYSSVQQNQTQPMPQAPNHIQYAAYNPPPRPPPPSITYPGISEVDGTDLKSRI